MNPSWLGLAEYGLAQAYFIACKYAEAEPPLVHRRDRATLVHLVRGDLDREEIVDDVAPLARENEVRLFLSPVLRMLGSIHVQSAPV